MPNSAKTNCAILSVLLATTVCMPVLSQDTKSQAASTGNVPAAAAPASNAAPATTATSTPAVTTTTAPAATTDATTDAAGPKVMFKPGAELSVGTDTEDITPTWDLELAKKQAAAFPDSAEASFILAVALTRTSQVEQALKEVQHARRLAESKGGPTYFDKMIETYEKSLVAYPDNNEARYGLAWAYYMKAYLLAQHSRRIARWKKANPELAARMNPTPGTTSGAAPNTAPTTNGTAGGAKPAISGSDVAKALSSGNPLALAGVASAVVNGKSVDTASMQLPSALKDVEPQDVAQIKRYYELALQKLDDLLQRQPDDVWSTVYRAHLKAEYTGNLNEAMATWRAASSKYPKNPAPYFFLGEGYLKQGNLKESLQYVSRAIQLRAVGM